MARKILYLNLVICLLFTLGFLQGCTKKSALKKKAQETGGIEVASASREKDFLVFVNRLKKKNPFSRDHKEIYKYKFATGDLNLSGIFYDEKKPLAIINGQIVAEGDTVNDKQIIKIMPNEVVLKDKEKEYHLRAE